MTKTIPLLAAFLLAPVNSYADGDPLRGEKLYNRCSSCHAIISPEGEVLMKGGITGPNLYGVIGRQAGTEGDYRNGSERLPIGMFTDDMIRAGEQGLVWTSENLIEYAKDPIGFIRVFLNDPKARPNMSVKLRKGADDIVAFIATYSE